MTDDQTRTVAELLKDQRLSMLTTVAPDGTLISRPMALQEAEFDGDLWFFAERTSRKVAHVATSPQVNVTVGSGGSWVSLTGRASLVTDDARKKELWSAGVAAWFGDAGPEDDGVVLIKVYGDSAEYWSSAGGRLSTAISFAKSKLTGERYDGGENERVELP